MKNVLTPIVFLLGLVGAPHVFADEVSASETLYKEVCKNCHGPTAKGMASYPKLIGHGSDYLVARLEQYRAGEKIGPNSPLMIPHAAELTDEDIAGLAAYITTTFE